MGGRHWSAEEEDYFWNIIVPRSAVRQGIHRNNPEVKWEDLAAEMNRVFDGPARRRTYTAQGIYEHWFLRARQSKYSQQSRAYVEAYQAQMEKEGVPRTGVGFVQKQGPRARRRTPAKQTTAQKKARFRYAQRNTIVPLADVADEDEGEDNEEAADDVAPNNSGHVGNALAQHPSRFGAVADAEMDEDALFVGDGTLVESWDDNMTANPSVSHPHPNNTTGSSGNNTGNARHLSQAGLAVGNARHMSRADLATTNQLAHPSTHAGNATSTTAIAPSLYGTPISHGPSVSHPHPNNTTGSTGNNIGNARHLSQADLATTNQLAQPSTHAGNATSTTASPPSLYGTRISHGLQTAHLNPGSVGRTLGHSRHQSMVPAGNAWDSQHANSTEPLYSLQQTFSRVSRAPQHHPTNATGAIRDHGATRATATSSSYPLEGGNSSGTSQPTSTFNGMVRESGVVHRGARRDNRQSRYGQREHGQRDYGQRDYGQRDHGQRDHGQRVGHGQRVDYGQRDHGQHDYSQYGYGYYNDGQRDYGQPDYSQHSYGYRNDGQGEYGQLHGSMDNSLGFDIENPLAGLVTGSGNGTYGSGSDAYNMQENTTVTGHNATFAEFSQQPNHPPSGSHSHQNAFSGTAANMSTAIHHPAAGNASYNWQASAAFGFGGTDENSAVHAAATTEQTSAVILAPATDSETGAWGTRAPPFHDDNIQD